jgi:acetyl-CoA acyltransferase
MKNVVIVGYARSPFHFAKKGALARVRPDELVATVIAGLVARTGVKPEDSEQGLNVARLASFLAHLPMSVAATTVNRFCGSSMQAIHMAAGAIQLDAGEAFICAGVESMSRVPMMGFNPMPHPGLIKEFPQAYISMGQTAENVARKYQVTREQQQELTVASHRKAAAAQRDGKLKDEIVPIKTRDGVVDSDGCIRADTSQEALAALAPAFDAKGTVTAGTSSPLTDGASAVLVCTEDYASRNKLPVLARIKSVAVAGCAPEIMGIGPVAATQKALKRAGLAVKDIDIVELNEAFASQALACVRDLGLDLAKINIDGGALALGHPLGATGARITGKAASLLKREGKRYALATQCIGGGQGIATILEAA